jgi:hypothetical protein
MAEIIDQPALNSSKPEASQYRGLRHQLYQLIVKNEMERRNVQHIQLIQDLVASVLGEAADRSLANPDGGANHPSAQSQEVRHDESRVQQ